VLENPLYYDERGQIVSRVAGGALRLGRAEVRLLWRPSSTISCYLNMMLAVTAGVTICVVKTKSPALGVIACCTC
jgi:hypothetical protein